MNIFQCALYICDSFSPSDVGQPQRRHKLLQYLNLSTDVNTSVEFTKRVRKIRQDEFTKTPKLYSYDNGNKQIKVCKRYEKK